MAYSTTNQIQSEFKDITFSATSSVTDTEVTEIISMTDAEIDARLGVKYEVPITGTSALLICRTISTYISAARISKIVEVKTGEADKDMPRRIEERNAALKMIEDIVAGKMLLSDATSRSTRGGVRSYNYDNDIEAEIDVTKDQW